MSLEPFTWLTACRDDANRLPICRVSCYNIRIHYQAQGTAASSSSRVTPADSPNGPRATYSARSCRTLTPLLLPGDMDIPGYRLHPLTGRPARPMRACVSPDNWRVVFRFMDGVATDVDLIDYH